MKHTLLLLLLINTFSTFAQIDTVYFSDEHTPIVFSDDAQYFALNSLKQDGEVTLFNIKTSHKFVTYQYVSNAKEGYLSANGSATYFYPNGNVKYEGTYKDNFKVDIWKAYDENGKPKETIQIFSKFNDYEKNLFEYKILDNWDNFGRKVIDKGNGLYQYSDSLTTLVVNLKNGLPDGECKGKYKGHSFSEQYKKGELLKGEILVDNKKIIYDKIKESPSFIGGKKSMYEFISANLKYPASAQRYNRQGKVFIKFSIKTDNSLSDISVLKGIYQDCDSEAIRVVKLMDGNWNCGKTRGIKEDYWFTMPFNFVLE
ncbi:hypothetical protein GCM10011514_40170 [Emticicia aquatilis]|uniref:TonB C-terminal domain-containing protein n=1 Tax=Emticicia aquatilis TaxID=1537369 RepID=A0A916Z1F6_9BACT|nr:energy transducer TonB [Emticicia aquatilis]GGD71981.1 hypothetical protein GCM10011514_40170 [Emticicia aquatilis]